MVADRDYRSVTSVHRVLLHERIGPSEKLMSSLHFLKISGSVTCTTYVFQLAYRLKTLF